MKKQVDINLLTDTKEPLRCKSLILGSEFELELFVDEMGIVEISLEGEKDMQGILEAISFKCQTPVDTILPLLLVNLALLCRFPESSPRSTFSLNKDASLESTIH